MKQDQTTVAKLLRSSVEATVVWWGCSPGSFMKQVYTCQPQLPLGGRPPWEWKGDQLPPPMLNFWCYLSLPQRVFPVGNSPPPWKWPQRLQKYALSVGGLTVAPGTEICFQHRKNKITSKAKANGALAKFALKVILEKAAQAWKRVSLGRCCNIVHRTHSHLNQCHQFTCGQEH